MGPLSFAIRVSLHFTAADSVFPAECSKRQARANRIKLVCRWSSSIGRVAAPFGSGGSVSRAHCRVPCAEHLRVNASQVRVRPGFFGRSPSPDGGAEQAGFTALRQRCFQRIARGFVIRGRKLSQPQWLVEGGKTR